VTMSPMSDWHSFGPSDAAATDSRTRSITRRSAGQDIAMESHGVKVFIEPMALFSIVGTTMDWEETELASEFTFSNPNSKGECGCGESFNV
jgi:iron-sulfur cluster assembly protein